MLWCCSMAQWMSSIFGVRLLRYQEERSISRWALPETSSPLPAESFSIRRARGHEHEGRQPGMRMPPADGKRTARTICLSRFSPFTHPFPYAPSNPSNYEWHGFPAGVKLACKHVLDEFCTSPLSLGDIICKIMVNQTNCTNHTFVHNYFLVYTPIFRKARNFSFFVHIS